MVPLGKIACEYLENYIQSVRPQFYQSKENESLFKQKGREINSGSIWLLVVKYAKMANIGKEVTPHTFRRSCATEMIKRRANPMYVKELLGHNSLETIKSYCDLTIIDLKKAHQKYHPREK